MLTPSSSAGLSGQKRTGVREAAHSKYREISARWMHEGVFVGHCALTTVNFCNNSVLCPFGAQRRETKRRERRDEREKKRDKRRRRKQRRELRQDMQRQGRELWRGRCEKQRRWKRDERREERALITPPLVPSMFRHCMFCCECEFLHADQHAQRIVVKICSLGHIASPLIGHF